MQGAAGHRFTLHGELQKIQLRARFIEQGIRGNHGTHGGRGRAPEAGAERNALVDLHFEAEAGSQHFQHGEQRTPSGIAFRFLGQVARDTAHRADDYTRLLAPGDGDAITQRIHRKAKDVEPDGDVADRGRRERSGAIHAHRRAPR